MVLSLALLVLKTGVVTLNLVAAARGLELIPTLTNRMELLLLKLHRNRTTLNQSEYHTTCKRLMKVSCPKPLANEGIYPH